VGQGADAGIRGLVVAPELAHFACPTRACPHLDPLRGSSGRCVDVACQLHHRQAWAAAEAPDLADGIGMCREGNESGGDGVNVVPLANLAAVCEGQRRPLNRGTHGLPHQSPALARPPGAKGPNHHGLQVVAMHEHLHPCRRGRFQRRVRTGGGNGVRGEGCMAAGQRLAGAHMNESRPMAEGCGADGNRRVEDTWTKVGVLVRVSPGLNRTGKVEDDLRLDVVHNAVCIVGQEGRVCSDGRVGRGTRMPGAMYFSSALRQQTRDGTADEAAGPGDKNTAAKPVLRAGPCAGIVHGPSVHRGTLVAPWWATVAPLEVDLRPSRLLLLLLPVWGACDFSAGTKVFADSADTADVGGSSSDGGGDPAEGGTGAGGSGSGGGTAGDGGGADGVDPSTLDEDGDGVTVGDGDCDDGDPAVYPGATDLCDGRDQDCDGQTDEDARFEDVYEDNDTTAVFLDDLSGGGSLSVEALLDSGDDVDRFAFEIDDSTWSLWDMTIRLSNIPDGYRWRLRWIRPDGSTEESTGAGSVVLEGSDELLVDDAGVWEIVVESEDGAPCDSWYLLTVDFSG